ncbi:MAG: HEAT repeat domain-containing protein [Armatimonadia bacterium]
MIWLTAMLGLVAATAGLAAPPALPPPAVEEQSPALEQLASDAARPAWGPVAVLRGHRELLPLLKAAAASPEALRRQRAMFALGQLGSPANAALLRKSLHDHDKLTRLNAAVALCSIGDAIGLPGAAVALRYGPDWLRFYALHALWKLDTARSREALRDSRDFLSPFLQETLKGALAARPSRAVTALPAPVCSVATGSLHEAWLGIADLLVEESDFWWHKGDYEQCIRCQETALFFDPNYVDLYSNVAWLQWSMGRHGQGISTYRRGIAANPKSWEAYHALGQYYVLRKQPSLALPLMQQAASLGSPAVPRRQLGHVLEQLGQKAAADRVWRDILKLDPNDPIARRHLGCQ